MSHKTSEFLLFLWGVFGKKPQHSALLLSVCKIYVLSGLAFSRATFPVSQGSDLAVLIDPCKGSSDILQQKNVGCNPVVLCCLEFTNQ